MGRLSFSRLLKIVGVVLVAGIVVATLIPVGWQLRTGLHWLVEHFAIFFVTTLVFCFVWPRPMTVAAIMLPFAILIETAQALTPDRTADLPTALMASAGVASAALLADLVLWLSRKT
jgi:hypothetical protein